MKLEWQFSKCTIYTHLCVFRIFHVFKNSVFVSQEEKCLKMHVHSQPKQVTFVTAVLFEVQGFCFSRKIKAH